MNVPSNQRLLVPGPDSASVMWMISQSLIRISNRFPIFKQLWVTYWFFYHHFLIIFNTPLVISLKLIVSISCGEITEAFGEDHSHNTTNFTNLTILNFRRFFELKTSYAPKQQCINVSSTQAQERISVGMIDYLNLTTACYNYRWRH